VCLCLYLYVLLHEDLLLLKSTHCPDQYVQVPVRVRVGAPAHARLSWQKTHTPESVCVNICTFEEQLHSHIHCVSSGMVITRVWPEPYIYYAYHRMYGNYPARFAVHTPYTRMYVWFRPTLGHKCMYTPHMNMTVYWKISLQKLPCMP
jgi:hypothetical protein